MTLRDVLEGLWHLVLLGLLLTPVLRLLERRWWARAILGACIVSALVYHLVITRACQLQHPLCYWSTP